MSERSATGLVPSGRNPLVKSITDQNSTPHLFELPSLVTQWRSLFGRCQTGECLTSGYFLPEVNITWESNRPTFSSLLCGGRPACSVTMRRSQYTNIARARLRKSKQRDSPTSLTRGSDNVWCCSTWSGPVGKVSGFTTLGCGLLPWIEVCGWRHPGIGLLEKFKESPTQQLFYLHHGMVFPLTSHNWNRNIDHSINFYHYCGVFCKRNFS